MKKTIVALIVGMFLLNLVGAVEIFSGEPYTFELEEPYAYYSIVGNSTEINLNVSQEGNNVTFVFDKYTQLDSFTVLFFNKEKEIIHHYSGGGGGGGSSSRTKYIEVDNYIDREVEVYIDREQDEDEEIIEVTDEEDYLIFWTAIGVAVLMLFTMILIWRSLMRKKNKLLKRLEEVKEKLN